MIGAGPDPVDIRSAARRWLLLALAAAVPACGLGSPAAPVAPFILVGPPAFGVELAFCADEVNRYRASLGHRVLGRSAVLEAHAAEAALNDGTTRIAHQFFRSRAGGGVASAETEILWWRGFPVMAVIQKGLAQMWDVGPGGEHYEVLVGPYSEIGCGVFVNGPEVTVVQDFR